MIISALITDETHGMGKSICNKLLEKSSTLFLILSGKILIENSIIALLGKRIALLALLGIFSVAQAQTVKLPSYQTDLTQTSVSGLSSGAFMAAQFQVAFSNITVGAGIIAGGPFYCAGSYPFIAPMLTATTVCMNPQKVGVEPPDASKLLSAAKIFAQADLIDDTENLKEQKAYLFSGKSDHTVTTAVVDQTAAFYRLAGLPAKNIKYETDINAGHAIITNNNQDVACDVTAAPYINDCDITQSQVILEHIYGPLNPPAKVLSGKIIQFDQNEFERSPITSMSDAAYAFVPKSCDTETCRVHVAFHGCEQGAAKIGNQFYTTTGYNEMADTNNIIVLYPQVQASKLIPLNPEGCWDFWGYSSPNPFEPNFYSKQAPQMAAVKEMLDRLSQPRQQVSTAASAMH
ncbi:MAG: poly(3-hydroxybutyrate) depolymerase [Motiliproteus sp.]|jgi:poly(3-hydroxybutyrate) depolymerase